MEKPKILIIEDDPEISTCYVELFSDDYALQVLSSGIDAINLIGTTEDIDIVILDHYLPDLLGTEVLKKFKEIKPAIPVLFVTAYGDEDLAVKSFRYGAKDYMKKPFSFKELNGKIEFLLSFREQSKEIRRVLFHEDRPEGTITHSGNDYRNAYKIQKAIKFIEDNFMDKINLDIVAQHACMSKFYFSKIFKKEVGTSYQDYINNRRIEKAKALVKNNSCTITEVAFAVGYGDISHFERMFKRKVGYTPSQYRQSIMQK